MKKSGCFLSDDGAVLGHLITTVHRHNTEHFFTHATHIHKDYF